MRVTRNVVVSAVLGAIAVFGFSSQASARCEIDGEVFYMHANDTTRHAARTTVNGCDLHFITRGKVRFRSAQIVAKPQSGVLRKIANLEFRYRPQPGFRGTDRFALRVCGKTEKGRGCSTLHYDAMVE